VRIVDLACNMIRLSGKEPRMPGEPVTSPRDVAIKYVGSRPGEKLYEELWSGDEAVGETDHPKIMRLSRPAVDAQWLAAELAELERLADDGDTLEVVAKLNAIVRDPKREEPPTGTWTEPPIGEASPRTAAPPRQSG
jgi:FlaA1/EpsC-like NDP-sugar epimerase